MTLKLNEDIFENAKQNYIALAQEGAAPEEQGEAYEEMINALYESVKREARLEAETSAGIKGSGLDKEQYEFFNSINTEVGYKEEALLPETTIDQIFDDLTKGHPLLDALGVINAGVRLKFLKSETTGELVWGKIFDGIKGQLDANFASEEAIQNKATAYVVIPKDLDDLSVKWIERFVRLQITEVFATGLEVAFLNGDGKDKPIGLVRDVSKDVSVVDGVYPEKTASGTLEIDLEGTGKNNLITMRQIKKHHATKEDGKRLATAGKLNLVVSPEDAVDLEVAFAVPDANAAYVNRVPFNINIIESEAQAEGQVVSFVTGRYDAVVAGGVTIRKFDQTYALEDLDLYTAKQFAYGKAKDDKAAAIWNLQVTETASPAGV